MRRAIIEPLMEYAYAVLILDLEPSVRHMVKLWYSSSMLLMARLYEVLSDLGSSVRSSLMFG